jgi:hypothetical protein
MGRGMGKGMDANICIACLRQVVAFAPKAINWAAYHSQARRPRAAHKRRLAARDTTSESDEGEEEGSDWDECYGVRMSPENPQYVAQGTAHVGGRWCILSPRSGYFCVLNQTTRSVGSPRVRWGGLSQGNGMRPPMRKTNETANRLRGN